MTDQPTAEQILEESFSNEYRGIGVAIIQTLNAAGFRIVQKDSDPHVEIVDDLVYVCFKEGMSKRVMSFAEYEQRLVGRIAPPGSIVVYGSGLEDSEYDARAVVESTDPADPAEWYRLTKRDET